MMIRALTAATCALCALLVLPTVALAAAPPPPSQPAAPAADRRMTIRARHVDILATGHAFCADAVDKAPAGMQCPSWKDESSGLKPPGALKGAVGGKDPCALIKSLEAAPQAALSDRAQDERKALLAACNYPAGESPTFVKLSSADALDPASMIFLTALQGLGDYLQTLAKEELVDFAVQTFAKDFCQSGAALGGQKLFPTACSTLFPNGYDKPPDTGTVMNGQFVEAVKKDALNLPGVLVGELPITNTTLPPDGSTLRAELVVLANDLTNVAAQQDVSVLDFLETLRGDVRKDPEARRLDCTFSATDVPTPACVGALVVEVAGDAKHELTGPDGKVVARDVASIEHWLQDAAIDFCQNYNAGHPTDGSGIFGADARVWSWLQQVISTVETFYGQVATIGPTLQQAQKMGRFRSEVEPAMLADTSSAVGAFASGLLEVVDGVSRLNQADVQKKLQAAPTDAALSRQLASFATLSEIIQVAQDAMAFVAAALKKDLADALSKLEKVLSDPLVTRNLDTRFAKAATFVLTLAQAKDRAEAQKIIQDAAAPLGTYRAKYTANTIMINGYLGIFGVARIGTVTETSSPTYPGLGSPYIQPISAPVGVEFSYANCVFDLLHCGLSAVIIDPLAVRVINDSSGPIDVDFDGVLSPGVLFHVGIARSPIDFMAGAVIQPLLTSSAHTCGGAGVDKACWQAPINLQLGLSVDAPLLELK